MKNKLPDLNNYLFARLDELSDESLSEEDLEHAIERARATASISKQILHTATVSMRAEQLIDEGKDRSGRIKKMIASDVF